MVTHSILLLLVIQALAVSSQVANANHADSVTNDRHSFTIHALGFPSLYYTRVFVNGTFAGTIPGGGSMTTKFDFSTQIAVDPYVPNGYPYYSGFPFASGYSGVAFVNPQRTITVTTDGSHSFDYFPVFLIVVLSEQGRPYGGGWYAPGSIARISVEPIVEVGAGTRYRFDRWSGGSLVEDPAKPDNGVVVSAPAVVTANWVKQHQVSITSPYGQETVTGGGWYDEGATASFSVTSPIRGGEGVRRVFTGWSGDYAGKDTSGTVSVRQPMNIAANWKTQNWVTIDDAGGKVDKTSQWVEEGTPLTVTATSLTSLPVEGSRLRFTGWSGDVTETSTTLTVTVNSPMNIKANWKRQHELRIKTAFSVVVGGGWYDEGATATITLAEFKVPAGWLGWLGVNNVFTHWTGDAKGTDQKLSVLMDSPKDVEAVWSTNFTPLYVVGTFAAVGAGVGAWKRESIIQYAKPVFHRIPGYVRKKPLRSSIEPATLIKAVDETDSAYELAFRCSSCGESVTADSSFCINCGNPTRQ